MKILQNKALWIVAALMSLMALTRFNHFGSSAVLPDASYAIYFLGGLYLGRTRAALGLLALLLVEAALIDYYAINFGGIGGWCVTSAYGFLVLAYSSLWLVGRWYAPRHDLTGKSLLGLFVAAVAAGSLAFMIANVSFYLLAGYFGRMSAGDYTSSVAPYFVPYVEIAVMYIGMAVIVQMLHAVLKGKHRGANAV